MSTFEASEEVRKEEIRDLNLRGHVGFDSLPHQLVKRCNHEGFVFNILCIGETGVGKSTLMASLFNINSESTRSSHFVPGVKLKSKNFHLEEKGIHLTLTIVETVGYGDQINRKDNFLPIVDYIDAQFEMYLQEELKIKRSLSVYHDTRIHACLYFICPTGHKLKTIDLICMKSLQNKVNIIPIIAKADTMSKDDLKRFKENIRNELRKENIPVYLFPIDDEATADVNRMMNDAIPFATVGSQEFVRIDNKLVRARHYPWGTMLVENIEHSDFLKLREMLIQTNMEDMRDQTQSNHYEQYRSRRMETMGYSDIGGGDELTSVTHIYEKKREDLRREMQNKENDIREMFVERVKKKELELKEAEKEMHEKYDVLFEQLQFESKALEQSRKMLDDEIVLFKVKKENAERKMTPAFSSRSKMSIR